MGGFRNSLNPLPPPDHPASAIIVVNCNASGFFFSKSYVIHKSCTCIPSIINIFNIYAGELAQNLALSTLIILVYSCLASCIFPCVNIPDRNDIFSDITSQVYKQVNEGFQKAAKTLLD